MANVPLVKTTGREPGPHQPRGGKWASKLTRPIHSVVANLPRETMPGGELSRAAIRTENSIVVFNWIIPHDDHVPFHSHPFDQTVYIVSGTAQFTLGEEIFTVRAGGCLQIPAGVPHKGLVVGDTPVFNIDIFAPIREDYLHLVEHQADAFE